MRVEFLLEEYSMKVLLENLLPRILPGSMRLNEHYFLRVHEGKSDLQKSIPRKIKALSYQTEPVVIIILHDQDSNDCRTLKSQLQELCNRGNNEVPCLIRIVCRELEAWYLGDMDAIESAYPSFSAKRYKNKAKYRNPDSINASHEIKRLLPNFQKVGGARKIAPFLTIDNNKSPSFQCFISGLNRFLIDP